MRPPLLPYACSLPPVEPPRGYFKCRCAGELLTAQRAGAEQRAPPHYSATVQSQGETVIQTSNVSERCQGLQPIRARSASVPARRGFDYRYKAQVNGVAAGPGAKHCAEIERDV
ncbi:hypothetical protein NDU88_003594 [Pleurodeles waltl]|uniref:Uncharacterized protein n=1 Tax=Pleurodeles waltl TaxID=8319 RepID=A0AAV7L6D2_PLEWA|nr:hypothetical protein NDU88_003594 [Pleurodeles waltl]